MTDFPQRSYRLVKLITGLKSDRNYVQDMQLIFFFLFGRQNAHLNSTSLVKVLYIHTGAPGHSSQAVSSDFQDKSKPIKTSNLSRRLIISKTFDEVGMYKA